jgi:hypothetical protein
LFQVLYPTGATETIEYESNSFYDEAAADSVLGEGIRVRKVTVSPGDGLEPMERYYSYLLANGTTSGRQLYRPAFAFGTRDSIYRSPDNIAPDGGVLYSRVTERLPGKGWTVYDFKNPGTYPAVNEPPDWTATRTRLARRDCQSLGFAQAGFYAFPFAPNTNLDFDRGLLDKVSDYSESGVLVRQRSYEYNKLATSPSTIKGLRFEGLDDGLYAYSIYTILVDVSKVIVSESLSLADELTPSRMIETITTYDYNPVHHLLESTSVANSDGTVLRAKYRYAKDFATLTDPDPAKPDAEAIKFLNDNFRHGEVIETVTYRKEPDTAETTLVASMKLYKEFGGRTLPHVNMEFMSGEGFQETTVGGSPQYLVIDPGYLGVDTIVSVNHLGLPVSMADHRRNKSGVHYGMGSAGIMATVNGAYAEETVFEGFERSSVQMEIVGDNTPVAGWTGEKGMRISPSTVLLKHNIQKTRARYRFSCWVRSDSEPQITASASHGSLIQSTQLTYSGGGQWQYLEGTMDVGPLSSGFTLEIAADAVAELDDIRFLPEQASMSTRTFLPLVGATSASDDRGVSVFWEYDVLGRLRYIRDRNKNIIQVDDYRFKSEPIALLKSNFIDDVPADGLLIGDDIFLVAPSNCKAVSHEWEVDGVQVSSSPEIDFEFTKPGLHVVKYKTIAEGDTVATTRTYCVAPDPSLVSFQLHTTSDILYRCEASTARTVNVSGLANCPNESTLTYEWYYQPAGSILWYEIPDQGSSVTFDIAVAHGLGPYTLRCVITGVCGIYDSPDPGCNDTVAFSAGQTMHFAYEDDRPCL